MMDSASALEGTAQLVGVGPDGSTLIAVDPQWGPVTIYRVHAEQEVRAGIDNRLSLLMSSPVVCSLAILHVDWDARRVVVARGARVLSDVIAPPLEGAGHDEPDGQARLRMALDIARALADLHRMGLVHGSLDPSVVAVMSDGTVLLDPTGLRCRTPNHVITDGGQRAGEGRASDLWALGAIMLALFEGAEAAIVFAALGKDERSTHGSSAGATVAFTLARALMNTEPAWRPSASEVVRRLTAVCQGSVSLSSATLTARERDTYGDRSSDPSHVGRFRLAELIGEGAMGRVFRATDVSTGAIVAVKIVGGEEPPSARAIQRFKKEARILSEINNPGVVAHIDFGEEEGCLWMAVEYVAGETLGTLLRTRGALSEREAVGIVADLCRALVDVHERGIVHRDIKPENVIVIVSSAVAASGPSGGAPAARGMQVKLIDFGIARHLEETESLALTRRGAVLGTPLYMSPEQARGETVDTSTDVYALGTLLHELLTGAAPFAGHGAAIVLAMQIEQTPTPLAELRPDLSAEVSRVVSRCLEKDASARPHDARELLSMLLYSERAPTSIAQHPQSPQAHGLSRWVFEWDLRGTPRELWPLVSSTDRLNRAIGLGPVEEQVKIEDGDALRFGHSRQAGFALSWREHPYEWVHERRIGVLREYSKGPLRLMRSTVELRELPAPAGGGGSRTHIVHTIEIEPRGLLGRATAAVEVGVRTRRALDRVYRRIEDLVQRQGKAGAAGPQLDDAFEVVQPLARANAQRLAVLERKVVERGGELALVAGLADFVRRASAAELGRIRPLALARRMAVDEQAFVRVCFMAAYEGMLVPLWDLLCPTCRVPSAMAETLRALKEHARCEVCNIDFALDLANSIELVFKVHPQLRAADVGTYCLSSPQKTPHVAAQVRIAAGERFTLDMALPEGAYQLVGPRVGYSVSFRARADAPLTRWELSLKDGPAPGLGRVLCAGRQEMVLWNDTGREQLVRVERTAQRDDVLTAARVAAHPLFRQLYPEEVFSPGALVRIASAVFVHVEVRGIIGDEAGRGDASCYAALYSAYKAIEGEVSDAGGTIVKLLGDAVFAVFDEPAAALCAALRFNDCVKRCAPDARVRSAVHCGPAAAVTMNDRLDYFGRSVHTAMAMVAGARDGEVVVSDEVLTDAAVQKLIDERARAGLLPAHARNDRGEPLRVA